MLTMHRLGWDISQALTWIDPWGHRWQPTADSPGEILCAIKRSIQAWQLQRITAAHALHPGLVTPWPQPFLAAIRTFTSQQLGALAAIISQQEWTMTRRFEAGFVSSPLCRACGQAPDTPAHRRFQCPALERWGFLGAYPVRDAILLERTVNVTPQQELAQVHCIRPVPTYTTQPAAAYAVQWWGGAQVVIGIHLHGRVRP